MQQAFSHSQLRSNLTPMETSDVHPYSLELQQPCGDDRSYDGLARKHTASPHRSATVGWLAGRQL